MIEQSQFEDRLFENIVEGEKKMGLLGVREILENAKRAESLFKQITNYPNPEKDINIQIWEGQVYLN